MISNVVETHQFKKSFSEIPANVQDDFLHAFELFLEDPHHPTLRTHSLQGSLSSRYAFSINPEYRCIYRLSKEGTEIILFDIGDHSIYTR